MTSALMRGVAGAANPTGLVTKNGTAMPSSPSYLQAQEEARRHKLLDDAWKHYTGDLHGAVRIEPGQPDVNVVTNRASAIVDTGVNFLYGKTVKLEVKKNGAPNAEAQKVLDGCWGNDAKRMTLLSKLAQNGGVFGHVFAKIIPPNPDKKRPYCRLVPLDPAQVKVVTHPYDCDTVLVYVVEWNEQSISGLFSTTRMQVIARQDPDNDADDFDSGLDPDSTWNISNWVRGPNNQWYQVGEAETWAHPWAPVHDWQNLPLANAHWGQSDIPPNIRHLNDVLNLSLTFANQLAKHHSFPYMYATGLGSLTTLDVRPGNITQFHSDAGKLAAVEAHGDMVGLLNFAQDVRLDMDEQTGIPAIATGRYRDVPSVTSGVALQTMYGPALAKTTHKQRLYETGHEEVSLRMLSLCGYGDGTGQDGWEVCTHWPDILPADDVATAQLALAMDQVGTSKHAVYEVLKVDYDEDQEYLADEAKDAAKLAKLNPPMPVPVAPAPAPGGSNQASGDSPQDGQPQPPAGNLNDPRMQAGRQAAKAAGAAMKK